MPRGAAGQGSVRLIPRVRLAGFNQGCSIGCEKCSGTSCDEFNGDGSTLGKPQKCCEHPMEPTLFARGPGGPDADSLSPRTYNEHQTPGAGAYDRFHYTPWRAPGHAPIADPCGVAGGSSSSGAPGKLAPGAVAPPGFKQGTRGSGLPPVHAPAVWKAG